MFWVFVCSFYDFPTYVPGMAIQLRGAAVFLSGYDFPRPLTYLLSLRPH